jgi:hypothetical protein
MRKLRKTPPGRLEAVDLSPRAGRGEGGQNAFAPVLGGGRFTQPGADGGERLTHHYMIRIT